MHTTGKFAYTSYMVYIYRSRCEYILHVFSGLEDMPGLNDDNKIRVLTQGNNGEL